VCFVDSLGTILTLASLTTSAAKPVLSLASSNPVSSPDDGNINLSIGRRIRRRRRLMGMTQKDLGDILGLQFQQVQKYECSSSRVTASRLYLLASALKVPIAYFFTDLPENPANGISDSDRARMATTEMLCEKETQELLSAYARLPEPVRRKLRTFAKGLGEDLA
jgi:transcriptional regulator with XRE-family HTH domain